MNDAEIVKKLKEEPLLFVRTVFPHIALWEKQVEILNAVRDNRKVIVPAGFSVGKTFIASIIVLWYLFTRRSIVLTTAPTWRQVKSILWSEIRSLWRSAYYPLGGEILETSLKIEDRWFAMGLSTDDPEKFQGYHEENILIIFDEAPGVRAELWDITEGIMTSQNARWLAIGNPVSLYDNFGQNTMKPEWKCIPISCFDHPNVKTGKPIYPKMVTREWVEERKKEWGEDNPLYISRVLGKIPTAETDTFIPAIWVEDAVDREVDVKPDDILGIGCDVARFGLDKTVIIVRKGMKVLEVVSYQGQDLMWTVGMIRSLLEKYNFDPKKDFLNIDDTGLGGGVTDRLRELSCQVNPINFASKSPSGKYADIATEMWANLKEMFRSQTISIPNDLNLKKDLVSRRYKMTSIGIKLESKEEMKARGLNSPDYADALALAFYVIPKRQFRVEVI